MAPVRSIAAAALCGALRLSTASPCSVDQALGFSAPTDVPSEASDIVPHDFASFSWPAHWFADFAGNASHPNRFSMDILDLLAAKSGARPFIRVGGTSTDRVWFNASQEVNAINDFSASGSLTSNIGIPDWVYIGPSFFEGFLNFPNTPWSWQINMGKTYGQAGGLENAMEVARRVMHAVQDRLESFEIGNEPDIFWLVKHRPRNYTMAEYISEWNQYADAASESVLKGNQYGLEETRFFQGLTTTGDNEGWTAQDALEGGLDKNNHLRSLAMHHYDGGGQEWVRLGTSLMNHTSTAANVSSLDNAIEAAHNFDPYLPYILGETNSDSSNLNFTQVIGVFGSSLWLVDRIFLSMAANIQRMNLIQGTTFGYTAWVPVPVDDRDPYVRPPLYGQIFAADAIGQDSDIQVYPLPSSTWNFSTHAIYKSGKLAKYVLLNLDEWNSTTPYPRPKQRVQLDVPETVCEVSVERLTASGASADEGIKWAGMSWNYTDGRLVADGEHKAEKLKVKKGVVHLEIASTEAALVTLNEA
ncbi:glycoside hydrolase family 79 protein [Decorospora gaudefroyi]|uniref:Glycoside hydrolase family 79 protein n=1 Tax=Decorospora gaudefroyi TaxID=184978 RepID=A0A6A5JVW4_9PLEO|nr:glycoside hydrolase family 79 protein [Decorospora gaudefroyi]